ncbi:MAG: hypothetical protein WD355_08285 [Balneolaceae bacterium]
MKNRYVNRAKISESKFRDLLRFFSLDLTAIQIAKLTGLNRNTVNRYLTEIRKKITRFSELTSPVSVQRPRFEEPGNQSSWSILIKEHETLIYTDTIPGEWISNSGKDEIHILLKRYGFDLLIDLKSNRHYTLLREHGDPARHRITVNRLESFWGSASSRLVKFKGMHSSTFRYHLKECEFRFNYRDRDLYPFLLKILRNDPLF